MFYKFAHNHQISSKIFVSTCVLLLYIYAVYRYSYIVGAKNAKIHQDSTYSTSLHPLEGNHGHLAERLQQSLPVLFTDYYVLQMPCKTPRRMREREATTRMTQKTHIHT